MPSTGPRTFSGLEQGDETKPLLTSPSSIVQDTQPKMRLSAATPEAQIRWLPVVLVQAMLIVNGFGYFISVAPQTQLFENVVCDAYKYSSTPAQDEHPRATPQDDCKRAVVQEALAMLYGWQALFDGIPGLVLALPFGVAADKIGRKLVCWKQLPFRLVWLPSAFTIIGGGSTVAMAVCMMIIVDSVPEQHRSKLFFLLQGSFMVTEIIGAPVGSILMERNLWTPVILGLICTILSASLAALVPETLIRAASSAPREPPGSTHTKGRQSFGQGTKSWIGHCLVTTKFVVRDSNVAFLVLSILVADFGRQSLSLLLRYVSDRYGWSIAKANYLLSLRASAQLIIFMLVLPAIDSCLMHKARWPTKTKDFRLASICLWLLAISFLVLAIAPGVMIIVCGLVLYTLGAGFATFARSLVSAIVEPTMIGTLYTTISMMETTASLLAGPLMAGTFRWGIQLGGV